MKHLAAKTPTMRWTWRLHPHPNPWPEKFDLLKSRPLNSHYQFYFHAEGDWPTCTNEEQRDRDRKTRHSLAVSALCVYVCLSLVGVMLSQPHSPLWLICRPVFTHLQAFWHWCPLGAPSVSSWHCSLAVHNLAGDVCGCVCRLRIWSCLPVRWRAPSNVGHSLCSNIQSWPGPWHNNLMLNAFQKTPSWNPPTAWPLTNSMSLRNWRPDIQIRCSGPVFLCCFFCNNVTCWTPLKL